MSNKNAICFTVKSKYYSVYWAYKTELEKIGYELNFGFNPFCEEVIKNNDCMCVSNRWNFKDTDPMFSLSNYGYNTLMIDLDTEFARAVEHAKNEYERVKDTPIEVRLNDEYTAKVYSDRVVVGCQTFAYSALDQVQKAMTRKWLRK
jgi:DNA modification methylase